MFYDNVLKLCEERGVKITNVITALGFSQGNLIGKTDAFRVLIQ